MKKLLAALAILALTTPALAEDKLKLLIVDGQNNHNWKAMTPPMKASLENTGRFTVDVATTPDNKAPKEAWESFHPEFTKYDVVLSNYNGQAWPDRVQRDLENYVANGGGLVVVHAANNAFEKWPEWNKMIGLGWRGNNFGARVTLDDAGQIVRTPAGEGPGAGHGPQHAYKVVVRDKEHPVTAGMPAEWMHAQDELYHGQRGPAEHMQILATAYSDKSKGGTGTNEPMVWVIPYGKGRVFTNVLGHVSGPNAPAIECVGFQTLVARGAEWAATGKVTIPVPKNFPTEDKVSLSK
jgi:type 1 glutamine amidotransferase